MTQKHIYQDMNPEQVRNLLKYIDASQTEKVKESIFNQLGQDCFFTRHLDQWVDSYQGDVEAFLDRINVQQTSKYWERLEFNPERSELTLTGRPVQGCACAFADCEQPPISLCHYCCKNFQQELFGRLLDQKVDVTITASFLLGDDRCNTKIKLV